MGLTVHFEVLNQLGTPMMYSSSLATRPAAGIAGRIFFRTDSPYGVYRDNGSSWDQIAGSGGGGGLTGSGTATQVAYFDSATNLTSSANLYWDATNSRLGINTATPGVALDIHSATATVIHANNTTLGNAFMNFQLQGTGKWQIGNVYSAGTNYFRIFDQLNSTERLKIQNTGQIDETGWSITTNTVTGITGTTPSALPSSAFSNNFTFNSGISTSASVNTIGLLMDNNLNYSGSNTINATSYNASGLYRNVLTFGSASATVTYTQASGNIRALVNNQIQYLQNGANSGTISHYANFQILGDQKTGAGLTTFTNRYGILINDYNEFAAGNTYTNRWGIYQAGLNENNFFAGKVGIGSGATFSAYQLDVFGQVRLYPRGAINGGFEFTYSDVFNICHSGAFTYYSAGNLLSLGGVTYTLIGANKNDTQSQVLLGYTMTTTSGVSASAKLDIKSTTQGVLLPRMTTTQKNAISSPAVGLFLFDTTLVKLCVYNGTAWETVTSV